MRLFQKQLPNTGHTAKSGFPRDSSTRGMFARTVELIKIAKFLQWQWYKKIYKYLSKLKTWTVHLTKINSAFGKITKFSNSKKTKTLL